MSKKNIVLAFDIERSGSSYNDYTIAIGASVINEDYIELDSILLCGYIPNQIQFELRCYDEFWSKFPDVLKQITYTGELNFVQRQKEMIQQFHEFRVKWELYASINNCNLVLCSDNNIYDGGFINKMMFDYLPGTLPIPYDTLGQYSSFWETHSMQRGLLALADPDWSQDWGLTAHIESIYDTPEKKKHHDHNPAHDAYNIAYELQIIFGIQSKRIKKRAPILELD